MQRWAVLQNNIVINIIEGLQLQGLRLPLDQQIVNSGQYPVSIDDRYIDGLWKRFDDAGVEITIEPIPTAEQQLSKANTKIQTLTTRLSAQQEINEIQDDTIIGMYENAQFFKQTTDDAIIAIYESVILGIQV